MPDETKETLQDEAIKHGLDEKGQKLYGLVDETVQLFKSRIDNGELTPWDVAEALAVTLSGTIVSIVPPPQLKAVQREADSISQYLVKRFDEKSAKKKYMFASQLLGSAKFASYIVAHGARMLDSRTAQGKKIAEEQLKDLLKDEEN